MGGRLKTRRGSHAIFLPGQCIQTINTSWPIAPLQMVTSTCVNLGPAHAEKKSS
jgi:hypothetical protein